MKAATFSAAVQNPEYSSPLYMSADDLPCSMAFTPTFKCKGSSLQPCSRATAVIEDTGSEGKKLKKCAGSDKQCGTKSIRQKLDLATASRDSGSAPAAAGPRPR